jgi:hypothetical protein
MLRADLRAIVGSAVAGLATLIVLSFWLVAGRVPFIVGAAVSVFTLIAIIYQAVVYRRQWNVMQQSLRQTEQVITKMQSQIIAARDQTEVLKKALAESEKMTSHTEASIAITQSGIEHAQRAYVTVVKREWGNNAFVLTLENSGNTPAREVAIDAVVTLAFGSFEMPAEITDQYTALGLLTPRGREVVVFEFDNAISEDDMPHYIDPEWGLHWYCNGFIMYRDIFQQDLGDYWIIKFCFYFDQFREVIRAESNGNEIEEYRQGKRVNSILVYGKPLKEASPPN